MLVQTYLYLKSLLSALIGSWAPISVSGTTASASPTVTATGSLTGVNVGAAISGTNIPANTTIIALDNAAHTITLSQNATGAGTHTFTVVNASVGGAPFNASMIVCLYQNNIAPSPNSVIGDFTEATFDGYSRSSAIVWNSVGVDDTGNPLTIGDQKLFQMNGATTPNTVYGYFVTDTGFTTLLFAESFATPKVMSGVGDQVAVVPTYGLANQS